MIEIFAMIGLLILWGIEDHLSKIEKHLERIGVTNL